MKKQTALITGLAAAGIGIAGEPLAAAGYLPVWAAQILAVIAFPAFVVFIALRWNAKTKDGDIPFIGY